MPLPAIVEEMFNVQTHVAHTAKKNARRIAAERRAVGDWLAAVYYTNEAHRWHARVVAIAKALYYLEYHVGRSL